MLELYWGLLITGVLFALVTVLFGDLLSSALDGLFDFMSGDALHYLQPMVLFSAITVLGGTGVLLTKYSAFATVLVLVLSLFAAAASAVLIFLLYVKPMENSENSVAFSMQDLVGRIGEVTVPIPAKGCGEVLVRAGGGVMIVTGSFLGSKNVMTDDTGRKIKIVRGGGSFILPIFQQAEFLSLLSHKLDVSTPEVYTEQGVPVMADGVAIIKIGGSVEDVATAAEQFMGKPTEALKGEAQEVLEGHLRAILGSMTVEEVYRNRDKFAQEVQGVAAKDLKKMGLQIVSFTIKDLRDKHGYLDALGKPRIAAVKRDAEIAEAQAVRDSRIQKAQAEEEGQKAELLRDTNIAEAEKEKELKVASFKKEQDMARAEADQAYHIQEARAKQSVVEEQMRVELVRKEREIDLEAKEILRREKQYDAEVKKKADADRYAVVQAAEAEKAKQITQADAMQYRIEAEAKAMAEQKRLEGQAVADAERAKGTAEAEVIRLRGLAEAEAKQKLAEAFEKFGEAAVLDIIVKMLPELAGKVAEPMKAIDKLTVVDTGHGEGAARVSNYVTSLMATAPEMLKSVSGIDLEQLVKGLTQRTAAANASALEAAAAAGDTAAAPKKDL